MPLYEYQCDSCRHRFEAIQKFSDPPLASCPKCGAALRKLQSAPAFQFKGDGWYITDYAKKDGEKKEGEKTDAAAGGKTDGKTDGTSSASSGASAETKSKESKGDGQTGTSSPSSSPSTSTSAPSPPGATKASS